MKLWNRLVGMINLSALKAKIVLLLFHINP